VKTKEKLKIIYWRKKHIIISSSDMQT